MADMVRKRRAKGGAKRSMKGTANPNVRLTPKQVDQIRRVYAKGAVTQQTLAAEYGVSQVQISNIIRGRSWS